MTDATLMSALGRFVLEHLAQPVLVLDGAGNVIATNRAASLDASLNAAFEPGEGRHPEIVAFVERLRATGHASLESPPELASAGQGPWRLSGNAVDRLFVVSVELRPRPAPRDSEQRQLRRLDTLGLLTARVAHDINNLLTPLLLLSRELVSDLEASGQNPSLAQEIELTAQRAACLLQSLLGFVRPARARSERLTLNAAVSDMRPLLELLVVPNVELRLTLDERPAQIHVDRVQLEHVLLNLVSNSIHAMPDGGLLRVSITHGDGPQSPIGGAGATYAVLAVEDTGCGMTAEVQRRAFEPFFTTRAAAGGTGLGLSSVQHFVKEHAGFLTLDSQPGRGTRISIHLPATAFSEDSPSTAASHATN